MSATPSPALVARLQGWIAARAGTRPPLIGVAGCQGSGKTTLCAHVAAIGGAAHFSLDDLYRTRAERAEMARDIHPLLATRGPPGTHDLALGEATIEVLSAARPGETTPIPAFDKLADDRAPADRWPRFTGRPSAILVDGWCLGALPGAEAELDEPINALERDQDPDGAWRRAGNAALAGPYAAFFARFDAILHLAAPDWAVVLDWRCEQEADLMEFAPGDLPAERRAAIAVFIAHYERITRRMLAGGVRAEATARLDKGRRVLRLIGLGSGAATA